MDGIVNILKPPGMTSHDVVYYVRKHTGIKKVGHTGTLDPQAVGVLPICIGKATKISEEITGKDKVYRAVLKLGVTTDTQDAEGSVLKEKEVNISKEILCETLARFKGEISQVPPMYSAIKIKGQKLYELARKGIEVDRPARKVMIHKIDVMDIDLGREEVLIEVICSKGTYIRTLCHDIGEKLGCGGHMQFLMRMASGPFHIEQAVTLEDFALLCKAHGIQSQLLPIDDFFAHYPRVTVKQAGEQKVVNGNVVSEKFLHVNEKAMVKGAIYRVYNQQGKFLCLSRMIHDHNNTRQLKLEKSFY